MTNGWIVSRVNGSKSHQGIIAVVTEHNSTGVYYAKWYIAIGCDSLMMLDKWNNSWVIYNDL